MTVNFKSPEGLEIIRKLIKKSDILVENFVSGKLASMGLGYEDCKKINSKLIYASITGQLFSPWFCCRLIRVILRRLWSDWALQNSRRLRCRH